MDERAKTKGGKQEPAAMPVLPGNDTFGYQTLLLARKLQADFLRSIRRTGLSPAQTNVLAEIARAGTLPQRDLAERLNIGNASIGQTIDRLESSGHISRTRGTVDRRTVYAELTTKGRRALHIIAEASWSQLNLLESRMGADVIESMTRMMIRINAELDATAVDIVE